MKNNEKAITYEEFQKLGRKHYNEGGDAIVECWDQKSFNNYCEEFGPMTEAKALDIIGLYDEDEQEAEAFRKWASGEPENGWWEMIGEETDYESEPEYWREEKEYGPSNPGDAPGMCASDFI